MGNDETRKYLGISFTNGPVKVTDNTPTEFYDPMCGAARQTHTDSALYRSSAQQAALARRTGFPSYLSKPKPAP